MIIIHLFIFYLVIIVLITVIGIKNKYESASLLFKVVSTTDHI